jgi:hypothetical protein
MVNLLTCTASAWRGAGDLCRWCNVGQVRGGRIFCSVRCADAYQLNHRYWIGREYVLMWSTAPCLCPIAPIGTSRKAFVRTLRPLPHRTCNACLECEGRILARGDRLTVNHIEPRNGIEISARDCIHHLDNLEPLCWRCHDQLNRLGNVRERLDDWIIAGGLLE